MDEQEILRLFGFNPLESQQGFQTQEVPQLAQGLLGGTGEQDQNLQSIIQGGNNAAANMAQVAQAANQSAGNGNSGLATRYAAGQQALNQQQQQQAQAGATLGKIASMFIPGGSVLGWLKKII